MRLVRTLFCLLLLLGASPAWCLTAPHTLGEPPGWMPLTPPRSLSLKAPSGDQGVWIQRDYRSPSGDRIHAEWLGGPAVADWKAPNPGISRDDAPLGFGAAYRTFPWEGCPALLETRPHLGLSLTVSLPGIGVLTLESPTADEKVLTDLARVLPVP